MAAKRILVPLDGRESGEKAAAFAADLARGSGGSVRLLRVSPVPRHWVGEYGRVVVYADQEMDRLSSEGLAYLATVEAQLPVVPVERVVRFGEPVEEILLEAEAFGADAIVVATERPTWFRRLTGRGIGQRVLRETSVPVALLRAA